MRKCTYFYATPADFHALMDLVEADETFVYLVHPDIHSPEIRVHERARDISDVLRMYPGHFEHSLFLVPPGTQVQAASYEHVTGRRYALRPTELPAAVVLQLWGEHPGGALVRSRFWAHGDAPEVRDIEATLFRHMRRTFGNEGGSKVGPEAAAQLLTGRRLTFDVNAPAEADLRPSSPALPSK
ncbi:hypothetical protein [Pseudoroseicyclus tamaricis]|uniref:Uncharacterized protein n=1 Tax=Pseudoroseicyclus tamaricis TaxID=2705421 RepID=A0A6B2JW05_9RHOB|nr:hypothetical protein [Pseudoroseicyclus tamaricis]NDU99571.1 hypothetical protein [Pseudoroseicyclus tamaricis]